MYKVLFINSMGKSKQIGNTESQEQAYAIISKFLDKYNFKSYYSRTWKTSDKTTVVDVGSHTEFFQIKEQ